MPRRGSTRLDYDDGLDVIGLEEKATAPLVINYQ